MTTNLIRGSLVIALIAGCHHDHTTPVAATTEPPGSSTMGQSTADTTPVPEPQPTEPSTTATAPGNPTAMASTCPMDVEGAQVTTATIDNGIALVFTTLTGDATDLRTRVRQMASDIEINGLMMKKSTTTTTTTGTAGAMGTMAAVVSVNVVDVDHGAKIEIKAKDAAKLEQLRSDARQEVSELQGGQCPVENNKVSSR